ncbi:hypothetical protein TNCV_2899691 [Trichonephila clavipes]|nr:hypothetical protein TNCV_2899691 [Trichonephila clavipes]
MGIHNNRRCHKRINVWRNYNHIFHKFPTPADALQGKILTVQQWILAHAHIEANECAESSIKEASHHGQPCTTSTLSDVNAVARSRLLLHFFKKPLITDFDFPRIITSRVTRRRTHPYKCIKIHVKQDLTSSVKTALKSNRSHPIISSIAQL